MFVLYLGVVGNGIRPMQIVPHIIILLLLALHLSLQCCQLIEVTLAYAALIALGLSLDGCQIGLRRDSEPSLHIGVAFTFGMNSLIRKRENNTFVNILSEIDLRISRINPHDLAIVLTLFVRDAHHQTTLVVDRYLTRLQAAVALAGNLTGNGKIYLHLRLALAHCSLHATISTQNLLTLVGGKQSIADLEIEVVSAVFQPFICHGILFTYLHLATNSRQNYNFFTKCANNYYFCSDVM